MDQNQQAQNRKKILQTLTILAVMILFFLALGTLRREVRMNRLDQVLEYFQEIPARQFLLALLASMGSYFALTLYDVLGIKHIKKSMSYWRTALTSFVAYSLSHNVGAAPITGGGIRYRFYSAWGLTAGESASVLLICGMTFWVGFMTMGALFFFLQPPELPPFQLPPAHFFFGTFQFDSTVFSGLVFGLGVFCVLAITAYLLSALFVRGTIRIAKWHFPTPSLPIALGQMAAGCLDWTCSGSVLYLLLPHSSLTFPSFMTIYLSAQLLGFLSQVPGGLGVLDVIILETLEPALPATSVAGALLAFRICYYFIPFLMGLLSFAGYEIVRNKEGFRRGLLILNRFAPDIAPHIFGWATFLAGAFAVMANAFPETPRRLLWLNESLPLGMIEGSHLLMGLTGALLLVTGRGLQQRLRSAYWMALVLLGLGVLGALFKGFDYKESLTLLILFGALLPCGLYFTRRNSVFQQRFPPLWVTAILFVLLSFIWVGVFNYRQEDYDPSLWNSFDLTGDSARFLRSGLLSTVTLAIFSLIALLSPTQPETDTPGMGELNRALGILRRSSRSMNLLALAGDKALFFNKKEDAFLMYAIEGKSWVVLGDPVGEAKEREDLALRFQDLCRRKKTWPLFFLVEPDHSQFYLDMGLSVMKVAEKARMPLTGFQVEGIPSTDLKHNHQRLKGNADLTFEVMPEGSFKALAPELGRISEEWLRKIKGREKGFSGGFFQERYLNYLPLGLVRQEGKLVAFANLLATADKAEISVDLLRWGAESPEGVEDYLLLECMAWASAQGFQWFHLGTAPTLDLEGGPLAAFKEKLAEILSPGITRPRPVDVRKEMDRFNAHWSTLYLAAPANLSLPAAFQDIQSLIAQGSRVRFKK
ncbi:MAG TPA: bifunctional lysylphosphatidylglycerol flippase/synthetase MprF [bacterium]|nr:bifunctional lysylphosphatidylglycerol flippase/synthetase MprF [bacterium]